MKSRILVSWNESKPSSPTSHIFVFFSLYSSKFQESKRSLLCTYNRSSACAGVNLFLFKAWIKKHVLQFLSQQEEEYSWRRSFKANTCKFGVDGIIKNLPTLRIHKSCITKRIQINKSTQSVENLVYSMFDVEDIGNIMDRGIKAFNLIFACSISLVISLML